ncbi:ion transporter [Pleionea litopenaei]|uniref:Ion transporter n=1 Tax=Pleionea litopenaei TaxID=3070815 RepID=A0AA51X5G8_9GAMM|nr:ion transporter [Pleionea sp. HL-JVS1]WMS85764.1 ion transporter [Pleionea sp. HL-JVS1]
MLKQFVENVRFQNFIIAIIVINAVILGLETSPQVTSKVGGLLTVIDTIILGIFVIEITLRLYVYRFKFFRDPWSLFDFFVVVVSLIPASGPFAILRALRVLRVLRLVSVAPSMRSVVSALIQSLPGMGAIVALLSLIFYVAAVMATTLFGENFPEWFGSLGNSLYTLFQIMTLESWSMGIVRPVMEKQPMAWLFFVPFILIATFTMLNLFIAVVVNAMQTKHEMEQGKSDREVIEEAHDEREILYREIMHLRKEMRVLNKKLEGSKVNTEK